ncbi:MAG TPA: formyltransferase family protein [Pyrinomonadaceae bacterium]|jgi:folate-dependent phosphoribosylglycinamide formyltransferase PurN
MNERKMKIAVLTHGGVNRLLELLSDVENVEIVGVFIETVTEPQRTFEQKLKRSIRYDGYWATAKKFAAKVFGGETAGAEEMKTVRGNQDQLERFARERNISIYKVENYHSEEAINLLKNANADLGILYGTNIVKETVFSVPRLGSINIHQGLAPLYRGGPTVFWELYNDEKEVGITVHFVAPKVDTGDIILQKTVPLFYDFSRYGLDYEKFLADFRAALREPSAQLLTEAVRLIAEGKEQRTKQDTSVGKRYRLPTKTEKDALLRILKKRRKSREIVGEANKPRYNNL